MKTLKITLVVLAILIAVPLVIALFVNEDYAVERDITVNQPKEKVFAYLKNLKNQDQYNEWILTDESLKRKFRGTDGTVGFVYAWEGEKAGKGEQEIKSFIENERIDTELRFVKPIESVAYAHMTTELVSGGKTRIKWGMAGESVYPFNLMNLFMEPMLGKDLETSLNRLKNQLENE